jgi:hypothetical protein
MFKVQGQINNEEMLSRKGPDAARAAKRQFRVQSSTFQVQPEPVPFKPFNR